MALLGKHQTLGFGSQISWSQSHGISPMSGFSLCVEYAWDARSLSALSCPLTVSLSKIDKQNL